MPVNEAFADGGRRRARPRARRGRVLPRLPPLPRAAARARRERPDALLAHFVHIPWPETGLLVRAARADPPARSTRACSRTTSSASTRAAGGATSCARARTSSAPRSTARRRRVGYDGRRVRSSQSHPISIDPAEFDELRDDAGRARAESELIARAGPSSSSCASTAPIRRRTSSAAFARSRSTSTRIPRCTAA